MKTCTRCKEEKELSEFRIVKKKYYRGECKECEAKTTREKTDKRRDYINTLKERNGCLICGQTMHYSALDLHHLDPEEKDSDFNKKVQWEMERLIEEIKKCVVLCANCHRLLHAGVVELPDSK